VSGPRKRYPAPGKFRISRIANPDSLWVGCPEDCCAGFEVPSGATLQEVMAAILAHVNTHEVMRDAWRVWGRIPRKDPHR